MVDDGAVCEDSLQSELWSLASDVAVAGRSNI